jgi:hypothetical protein
VVQPDQNGGAPCGPEEAVHDCSADVCPPSVAAPHTTPLPAVEVLNCLMSAWSSWGECGPWHTATGDNATTINRTRTIVYGPTNGGLPCPPALLDVAPCELPPPPTVDACVLSDWSEWSPCASVLSAVEEQQQQEPVAMGVQHRSRTVLHAGTEPCGALSDFRTCPLGPQNCVVGEWGPWSACRGGAQSRSRFVVAVPLRGGLPCPVLAEQRACVEPPAPCGACSPCVYSAPCAPCPVC